MGVRYQEWTGRNQLQKGGRRDRGRKGELYTVVGNGGRRGRGRTGERRELKNREGGI